MAELADAPDLGSGAREGVGVRVPPFAPPFSRRSLSRACANRVEAAPRSLRGQYDAKHSVVRSPCVKLAWIFSIHGQGTNETNSRLARAIVFQANATSGCISLTSSCSDTISNMHESHRMLACLDVVLQVAIRRIQIYYTENRRNKMCPGGPAKAIQLLSATLCAIMRYCAQSAAIARGAWVRTAFAACAHCQTSSAKTLFR